MSHAAGDPYLDPASGVLRNLLGITDAAELARAEPRLRCPASRLIDLERRRLPGRCYVSHLHRYILGDVYGWAGQLRTLSIAKGSVFCLPQHLTPGPAVAGAVMCSGAEEGWGVIEVPGVPCGCFVHFADIQMNGYRSSGPVGACNSLSGA